MDAVFVIFIIALYFLPSFIGWNKKGVSSVILINIFFGWTLIGWVVALLWAINTSPETKEYTYTCSYCGYKRTLNQKVSVYICPQCNEKRIIPENKPVLLKDIKKSQSSRNNKVKNKITEEQDPIQKLKENLRNDEIIIRVLGNRRIEVVNIKDWEEIIELGNASKFEILYRK